jgi:hypothetical protein
MEFCSFSNHIVDSTISQISNLKQQNGNFAYTEVSIFVVNFMAILHHNMENFIRLPGRDTCSYCHGTGTQQDL